MQIQFGHIKFTAQLLLYFSMRIFHMKYKIINNKIKTQGENNNIICTALKSVENIFNFGELRVWSVARLRMLPTQHITKQHKVDTNNTILVISKTGKYN
jgi:hypothetical protein